MNSKNIAHEQAQEGHQQVIKLHMNNHKDNIVQEKRQGHQQEVVKDVAKQEKDQQGQRVKHEPKNAKLGQGQKIVKNEEEKAEENVKGVFI